MRMRRKLALAAPTNRSGGRAMKSDRDSIRTRSASLPLRMRLNGCVGQKAAALLRQVEDQEVRAAVAVSVAQLMRFVSRKKRTSCWINSATWSTASSSKRSPSTRFARCRKARVWNRMRSLQELLYSGEMLDHLNVQTELANDRLKRDVKDVTRLAQ